MVVVDNYVNCELREEGEGAQHDGKTQAYKQKGNKF